MSYFVIHNANCANAFVSVYLLSQKTIKFVCVTSLGHLHSVSIFWKYRYECNGRLYQKLCHSIYDGKNRAIWECNIDVLKCDINFIIRIEGISQFWLSEIGRHERKEAAMPFAFVVPMIRKYELKRFIPQFPSWLNGCTFYEIFVDRYRKHKDIPGTHSWQTPPPKDDFFHTAIYGGSLQGIIHSIVFDGQYLQRLGIGGIYLTPVFSSPSNHKYDTEDYFSVDKTFGDKTDLVNLVQVAHENGIKVIMDGVFNHCSDKIRISNKKGNMVCLMDEIKKNGKLSPYYNWFEWITDEKWRGFANLSHIPILNTASDTCTNYLLDVIEYWTKLTDVDGWRLDVANELGDIFIKKIRKILNSKFSNKWLLGEILHNGEHWMDNELITGITNHQWREIVIQFVMGKISSAEFAEDLQSLWIRYPLTLYKGVINYLSNHDTARVMTQIECGQSYDIKIGQCIISVVLLFTSLGTPMVYYGDEIGMEGHEDPDCRRCMEWDEKYWDPFKRYGRKKLMEVYSRLIHFRRNNIWLADGLWQIQVCDNSQLLIYKRYNCCSIEEINVYTEEVIVIVNPSNRCFTVEVGKFLFWEHYADVLSGKKKDRKNLQKIQIQPFSSSILYSEKYE